jgi:hypothetical protein
MRHPYQLHAPSPFVGGDFAHITDGEDIFPAFAEGEDFIWEEVPASVHHPALLLSFFAFELFPWGGKTKFLWGRVPMVTGATAPALGTEAPFCEQLCQVLSDLPRITQMEVVDDLYEGIRRREGVDLREHLDAYARLRRDFAPPLLRAVLDDVARAPRHGRTDAELALHLGLGSAGPLAKVEGLMQDAVGALAEETGLTTGRDILLISDWGGECLFWLSFSAQWALRQLVFLEGFYSGRVAASASKRSRGERELLSTEPPPRVEHDWYAALDEEWFASLGDG